MTLDLSVIIPTRGRADRLEACVRSLATQRLNGSWELLVGVDGPDQGEAEAVERAIDGAGPEAVVVDSSPEPAGPAAARNRVIRRARGRWLLLLNDDVTAEPGLLEAHARAQAALATPSMLVGAAPWLVREPDRLFDRLIRETSMVFFYDQMTPERAGASGPDDPGFRAHDWGFRHAWTLNLSVETQAVRDAGLFCESLPGAAFEDVELAWRLKTALGMGVLYRPEAVVRHDHRYEPARYLERERSLGRDSAALALASPACAQELFRRDILSADEIASCEHAVERDRAAAEGLRASFERLAALPASAVSGPDAAEQIESLYQQHIPLKRWCWKAGLLEACGRVSTTGSLGPSAARRRTA